MTLFFFCLSLLFPEPAPGSAPGANRTPFKIHSNADNVSTSRFLKPFFRFFLNNQLKHRQKPAFFPFFSLALCHQGFLSSTFQIPLPSSLCMSVWHASSSFTPIVDLVKGLHIGPIHLPGDSSECR